MPAKAALLCSDPDPNPKPNPKPNPNPNLNPNLLISVDKDRNGLMEFDEFVQVCKKLNQEGELKTSNAPSKAAGAPAAGNDFKKVEKKLSETLAKGLNLPKGAAGLLCGVCTAPRKKSTGEPGRVASPNVEGA